MLKRRLIRVEMHSRGREGAGTGYQVLDNNNPCIILTFITWCITGEITYSTCPREPGYCVKQSGLDQNSGVIKLSSNTKRCFQQCKDHAGSTGCELILKRSNRGCYAHTNNIARGNGANRHFCWVFSKCTGAGKLIQLLWRVLWHYIVLIIICFYFIII